jgi:hypothetical protein
MSSPVRGSVEEDDDGSAERVDEDALLVVVVLEDVVALAAGAVDELDDVEPGADGWVLVVPDPE